MAKEDEVTHLKEAITALHQDCQDLAHFIVTARTEIAEIRPNDLKQQKLPRAGKELDAIVEATENATNQIMAATETIMSAKVTEPDVVNDACMEIFEACSFQDITGQRISKVVHTLEYIEDYLTRLTTAWGHEADQDTEEETAPVDADDESHLLDGPALDGEGVDQDYIDDMFDETPVEANGVEYTSSPKDGKTAAPKSGSQQSAQDEIDALFD